MDQRAKKTSLVLLPGLLCDRYVWRYQIESLADQADTLCVEWEGEDSLPAMAAKVLRNAPPRFALAGHSMGGRVALEVCRAAPERVERIALLNTGAAPRAQGAVGEEEERGRLALLDIARREGMRAMARQWIPPMVHPDRRLDTPLVEGIVEMFARKTPEIFACQIRALLNRPDANPVLERVRCPALLLSGEQDGWSPPVRHAEMAAKIPGSRLVVVANAGHMSLLERPNDVTRALLEWLLTD
jgi:pimeloyl-ACP methyl ester carboxylesterase